MRSVNGSMAVWTSLFWNREADRARDESIARKQESRPRLCNEFGPPVFLLGLNDFRRKIEGLTLLSLKYNRLFKQSHSITFLRYVVRIFYVYFLEKPIAANVLSYKYRSSSSLLFRVSNLN